MDSLVDELLREGRVQRPRVATAMRQVDRRHFVLPGTPAWEAYVDAPMPIGYDQTISAPHMHASCLDLLDRQLHEGAKVLDVGSGSGYLSAVMALMVGETGRVVGVEKFEPLVKDSIRNVQAAVPGLLESGRVRLVAGNVLEEGSPERLGGPFDAIHVGAAAAQLPNALVHALKPGGRMVIPVGPQGSYQVLQVVDKDEHGQAQVQDLMYVRYVPLTKPHHHRHHATT